LDLDETLIHCIKEENVKSDLDIEIEIQKVTMKFRISIRPGA